MATKRALRCNLCGRLFATRDGIVAHVKREHAKELAHALEKRQVESDRLGKH